MAYDLLSGKQTTRDWSLGSASASEVQAKLEEAARKTSTNLRAKIQEIAETFASPVDAADLYNMTKSSRDLAAQMVERAGELPKIYKTEKTNIVKWRLELEDLLAIAKLMRDAPLISAVKAPVQPGTEISDRFKNAISSPYALTLSALGKGVKARADVTSVINLPGGALEYAGDQARKGAAGLLGLPKWMIPVAVGAVLLGVAGYGAKQIGSLLPARAKGT